MLRLWQRIKSIWAAIGNVWLAKDLAIWLGVPTFAGAILGPLGIWAFRPISPFDFAILAPVFGGIAFGLAYIFAPKVQHHHSATIQLVGVQATGQVGSLVASGGINPSLTTTLTRAPQPLRDAARMAYEVVEGSLAERYICGLNRTPEKRISYFEFELLNADVKMSGKKLPSSISRPIPTEVLATLHPIEGLNELHELFDTEAVHYVDVTVDGEDLRNYLDELAARVSDLNKP